MNKNLEIIAQSGDDRLSDELNHATMCLINSAAGKGDYILTGLEGKSA